MALQTPNCLDLLSLASLLRDSGDKVLSGDSKLRLTPALLSKLNAAFSCLSVLGSSAGFQVTSAHASQPSATTLLHFLHDFVQKTYGLTISGNAHCQSYQHRSDAVDLRRFHSLRHLELRNCTVAHGSDSSSSRGLGGLSTLHSQLQALVLMHIFHPGDLLWDILADGASEVGPDIMWTKLSQLVVSYCGLRSLGHGLSLTCNLLWLDVSHNMLSDADALSRCLACLPNLCYLNLSYNRLTVVPVLSHDLSSSAPTKIQILLLSHNYVEKLNGIQHLISLKELNLEVNQLQDHMSLLPLRSLSSLQYIKLKGNPLSYHKHHRILASAYMPPRAVFRKHHYRRDTAKLLPFMLDGQKLSESELQAVKDGPPVSTLTKRDHVAGDLLSECAKATDSSRLSDSEIERSSRKSRKVREVVIEDFDTLEELNDKNFAENQMTGSLEISGEHLQTKKQLEDVRAHFGQNWLRAQAGFTVQELLGLQPSSSVRATGMLGSGVACKTGVPLSSSTPLSSPGHTPPVAPLVVPYPGHLDEQALESMILKRSPASQDQSEVVHTTQSSQYQTANDSDTVLNISAECGDSVSKGDTLSFPMEYDADAEEEEVELSTPANGLLVDENEDLGGGDHSKYLVNEVIQGQCSIQDLFLVTTSRYIKEIEPISGRVIQRWPLDVLESSVLLSGTPCRIQLIFNTVVQSKKERIYQMDLDEAQKHLLPSLKAILETRSLTALNVAAFRCFRCSGEFSVELNSRKVSKICPTCGSSLVFELDEAPLPTLSSSAKASSKSQKLVPADSTAELSKELLHSPSDSSIAHAGVSIRAPSTRLQVFADVHPPPTSMSPRSAASLESPGSAIQLVSDIASTAQIGLRRCESDIDIISNPSQSSIEVLDDVSRTSGTPGRKRSSEERQVVAVPSLLTVPEVSSPLAPLPAGLTESSSSGSLTDSVCTAYENNIGGTGGLGLRRDAHGLVNSVLKEESSRENSPHNKEDSGNVEPTLPLKSLSNVLDNLLQTMSSKMSASESLEKKLKRKTTSSEIQYNYVDFSSVDHRLKLHLHLSILDADEHEVLLFLLRGDVLTHNPESRYSGILVISTQRVYVLKITGPEEGDMVDRWVSRVHAMPQEKLLSITALPWNAGIWLSFQNSSLNSLIVVVRDQQYTHNLFTFLKQLPDDTDWKIESSPLEKHSVAATGILQDIVKDAFPDSDSSIRLVVLLTSSIIFKDDEEQCRAGNVLLVTATGLVLINSDLSWLLPPENTSYSSTSKCVGKQSLSNLIQVEANGFELWLQFLDETAGGEEMWRLTPQSDAVKEQILSSIRAPWEELFSVPLQVLQTNKL